MLDCNEDVVLSEPLIGLGRRRELLWKKVGAFDTLVQSESKRFNRWLQKFFLKYFNYFDMKSRRFFGNRL